MSEIKILHARILNIYTLPKKTGAYVITHTYDNMHAEKYVGSTKNLYSRMVNHYLDKNIIYIDLYLTDDISLAKSLERILINLINPLTNTQKVHLNSDDENIMNELLDDPKMKNYMLDNVVKIGYRYLNYVNYNNTEYEEYKNNTRKKRFTVSLDDEAYYLVKSKNYELYKNYKKDVSIQEIVSQCIKKGISLI